MLKVKGIQNLTKISRVKLILMGIAFALILVLTYAPYFLSRYYLWILQTIIIMATLSMSWYFFSGLTKYITLGSAAFTGIGLYFMAVYFDFLERQRISPPHPAIIILPGILVAGLICFALALAIGSVALRLKGIYFAIATFGASTLVIGIISWWQTRASVFQIPIPVKYLNPTLVYYTILATSLAVLLLIAFMCRSKFGLALRMIGESEDAATHVGVNTSLYKIIGFAVSAMCMGLVGAGSTIKYPTMNVQLAFDVIQYSFMPAVMTLLGGIGSAYGPIIGAVTMSLLNEYIRMNYSQYYLTIYGSLLVVIILFMPSGITGIVGKLKATKLTWRKKLAIKAPKMPP
ncbi:MAG: branched-chain amino acid ABC transporter permease [Candidatus Bathyarchaeia archaeon]